MISAPFESSAAGKLYAFKAQSAPGGSIGTNSAANTYVGPASALLGFYAVNPLGPLGAANRPAFGFSLGGTAPSGQVLVLSGSASAGPLRNDRRTVEYSGAAPQASSETWS